MNNFGKIKIPTSELNNKFANSATAVTPGSAKISVSVNTSKFEENNKSRYTYLRKLNLKNEHQILNIDLLINDS